MTFTPQQLAAIRRQRQAAEEAAAEDRVQHVVGEVFGLGGMTAASCRTRTGRLDAGRPSRVGLLREVRPPAVGRAACPGLRQQLSRDAAVHRLQQTARPLPCVNRSGGVSRWTVPSSSRVFVLVPADGSHACGCRIASRWRRVFKQAWCWTWTRHADAVLVIEPGRLVALCSRCGWRSNGIAMP